MGYTALTAFLDVKKRRSPEEAARLAYDAIVEAYEGNRLHALLQEEAVKLGALMDKADRVDELEREILGLKRRLKQIAALSAEKVEA